jgi:hypothetical protein
MLCPGHSDDDASPGFPNQDHARLRRRGAQVEIDGIVAQAELNEAGAPRATAALWNALPIEARLEHTKWSGRACGFRLPALAAAGELEHPVCSIYPGTPLIAVRPQVDNSVRRH